MQTAPATPRSSAGAGAARVSIIYLVGSGRSGTTLLSRLLDLQERYRAVGEPRYVGQEDTWELSCGCGTTHEKCELWGPLIARWEDPDRLRRWEAANRAGNLSQLAGLVAPTRPTPAVQRGLPELQHIYTSLAAGGYTVVDESKTPWLGYLLAHQPWADVRFVELVRHPSDVMRSRVTTKEYQPPTPREEAARHWLRTCVTADLLRRRTSQPWLRTAFTRFVDEPQAVLEEILGHPPQGLVGGAFEAVPNHIYLSNADKLRRGPDSVRPSSGRTPEPFEGAGPWEKMCLQWWNRWLGDRTELRRNWSPAGS